MDDNGGLQLLPESRKKIDIKIPGENRLLVLGVVALIIVGVLYAGLLYFNSSLSDKISEIDEQLMVLEAERDIDAEDKILVIKDQLRTIGSILDGHVVWTEFLGRLQAKTSPLVRYDSINLSIRENKVSLSAEAANYTVVARQIVAYLEDDIIKDLDLSEVKLLNNGRVGININISLDSSKILLSNISSQQ